MVVSMSKKLATTVYITEQQQAFLKELNLRSKVPVAEFIRQGIDLVVQRYRDLLPGQMDLLSPSEEPRALGVGLEQKNLNQITVRE